MAQPALTTLIKYYRIYKIYILQYFLLPTLDPAHG